MPLPTPFFERTRPLCESMAWKHWAGYYAVCHFHESPEREYNAVRHGAGLLDVSPLFKYDFTGRDAGKLLDYVLSKRVSKLKRGRVTYLCWTDDHGKVLDDGTCWRLGKRHWRVTAAGPAYYWFAQHAALFGDVTVTDVTDSVAALALQGPTSKAVLAEVCDADLEALGFFGLTEARFDAAGGPLTAHLTRTGYTGDLGYEIWVDPASALPLWDLLMARGAAHGILPIGLDALDISRIEAGFILRDVDYTGAHQAVIEDDKSTPYELNLGRTVQLDRAPFIGQRALRSEQERGSDWAFVGLDIDWDALEAHYADFDLPPALPSGAWRTIVPLYRGMRQVGRATSGTWSPTLKRNLALATVQAVHAAPGTTMDIEVMVAWERRRCPATVVPTPFYDPPRKKA